MRRPMLRRKGIGAVTMLWLLVAAALPVQADEVRSLGLSAGVFRFNKPDKQVEAGAELRLPTQTWKLVVATGIYYAAESSSTRVESSRWTRPETVPSRSGSWAASDDANRPPPLRLPARGFHVGE